MVEAQPPDALRIEAFVDEMANGLLHSGGLANTPRPTDEMEAVRGGRESTAEHPGHRAFRRRRHHVWHVSIGMPRVLLRQHSPDLVGIRLPDNHHPFLQLRLNCTLAFMG